MRLATLAALLCLALPARADAQRSGLLLGLGSDSGYRTLWIAPVDGRMAVAATHDDIVVPRDSGFWHVTVVRTCGVSYRTDMVVDSEPRDSTAFMDEAEDLVRWPMGTARPLGDHGVACDEAGRIAGRDISDSVNDDECYIGHVAITHVSPRLISTSWSQQTTEFCEPALYRMSEGNDVVDWHDDPVPLLEHLPPARQRWLLAEFERQKGDCATQDSPDEAWGIERATGGWKATFVTSGATVCRGESGGEVTTTIPVPASLARRDDAATWLPALKTAHGRVTDVFTSPGRDVVVARVGDRLIVHTVAGSALGPTVLELPLRQHERVVMTEWALGAHVARWTRELGAGR